MNEPVPPAAIPSTAERRRTGWGMLLPALAAWSLWNLFLLVQAWRG